MIDFCFRPFFFKAYGKRIQMPLLTRSNIFWTETCAVVQDTDPFMMLLNLLQLMHQKASRKLCLTSKMLVVAKAKEKLFAPELVKPVGDQPVHLVRLLIIYVTITFSFTTQCSKMIERV